MPTDNPISIPIFLHTSLPASGRSSSQGATRLNKPHVDPKNGAVYVGWSYNKGPSTSSTPPTAETPPAVTVPPKRKRKFEAINVNDLDPNLFYTLTPTSTNIVERYNPGPLKTHTTPSTTAPSSSGSKKKGSSLSREINVVNRLPRATEYGNPRSHVPAPQESIREQRRAQAIAIAKANAPVAKKAKTPATTAATKRKGSNHEIIDSRAASPELIAPAPTPVPATIPTTFAPRAGLKRTRSAGVTPISATLANGLGSSAVAVGSPLKLVTTPDDIVFPSRRPSRMSHSDQGQKPEVASVRKANSLSPTSTTVPIPAITISAATPGTDVSKPVRRPKPSSSKAMQGGLEMRRVVSASSIGKKAGGLQEMAKERSKREVTLPGRLRDYDVQAGPSTW